MNITLLTIGKCKDKAILSLCGDYQKRLTPFWPTSVIELADKSGDINAEKALIEKFLAKQKERATLMALDEKGKQHTSAAFARTLQQFETQNTRHIIVLIGGADGLHPDIKSSADLNLSLSAMTLPHMLVRPVILEQLYRAATILTGHPYHRE